MSKTNVVAVPIPTTESSNNRSVKYQETGINQSKGFIDGIRNTLFTIRNKKLVEKEYMSKGGKYKEVVLPTKQAASGILRSITNDCKAKFAVGINRLADNDYTELLAQQNDKFKADHPELYKGITEATKVAVNELCWEQTMHSIQRNLNEKVRTK